MLAQLEVHHCFLAITVHEGERAPTRALSATRVEDLALKSRNCRLVHVPFERHVITLVYFVARMRQSVCELAVVGQHQ